MAYIARVIEFSAGVVQAIDPDVVKQTAGPQIRIQVEFSVGEKGSGSLLARQAYRKASATLK